MDLKNGFISSHGSFSDVPFVARAFGHFFLFISSWSCRFSAPLSTFLLLMMSIGGRRGDYCGSRMGLCYTNLQILKSMVANAAIGNTDPTAGFDRQGTK